MWKLSTGLITAMQNHRVASVTRVIANTLTFASDSITDSASGLGDFKVGDFVHVATGVASAGNDNIIAKVLTVSATELTFASGTFSAVSSGPYYIVHSFSGGCFAEVLKNGRLDLYNGSQPADADTTEAGTLLASITLDGNAFTAGTATNGLNLDEIVSGTLKRATDPATSATEVWQGDGVADGTAQWGRWYGNAVGTGASTTAIRMDGLVSTSSGGDIVMANGRDIVIGAPATVTDVAVTIAGV